MKKADSSRLETLEALIAEKRRQETFLAKLEERRAGTPEHVFKRLYDEYLTKLTDAQVRAAAEAEALSGGLEDDDAALAEVEDRLAALEEERIEVQLRAEVEEWDAKETQKKMTVMTAAISMAEKERDARKAVADRTRALVEEARGGTPAGPRSGTPAAGAPTMRPTTAMAGGPNFDELAFLNSVVGRSSSPGAPAPRESKPVAQPAEIKESASAPTPRTPTPAPMPAAVVPAAEPAPVPAPAATPAATPAPAAVEPEKPAKPEPVSAATSEAAPSVPPSPAPPPPAQPSLNLETPRAPTAEPEAEEADEEEEETSAPSPLGKPTPRTSQQIKTLKCAECGSMNYPTEWYCERCGGELAAL